MFGMSTAQVQRAGKICNILGKEWRELVAGSEGFLTDQRHAGLLRHNVVWGEMDFMVCSATQGLWGVEGDSFGGGGGEYIV
jgi:hypothetical protein